MKRFVSLLASLAFAVLVASAAAVLAAQPSAGQTPTAVTLVGAGDISRCDTKGDTATARLLGSIPGTVFTAGDNAYYGRLPIPVQ
ncbi:MAG: hypothetical protein M3317_03075 [Actinomycetota bacterium]|nr:hypothetical protein [Actinomycetota bacterium]